MNEQARERFSQDVVDYVFLHEVGHEQVGSLKRIVFTILYLPAGLLAVGGIISLQAILIPAIYSDLNIMMTFIYLISVILIVLTLFIPFILTSWIDETLAEVYVISKIGMSQYKSVFEEVSEDSNPGILRKVGNVIRYPPDSLLFWVADLRGISPLSIY